MKASSTRRRTKQEIIEAKAAALAKEQAIQDKLKTIERLQQELAVVAAKQAEAVKAQDTINEMLSAGFLMVGKDGGYVPGPRAQGS